MYRLQITWTTGKTEWINKLFASYKEAQHYVYMSGDHAVDYKIEEQKLDGRI